MTRSRSIGKAQTIATTDVIKELRDATKKVEEYQRTSRIAADIAQTLLEKNIAFEKSNYDLERRLRNEEDEACALREALVTARTQLQSLGAYSRSQGRRGSLPRCATMPVKKLLEDTLEGVLVAELESEGLAGVNIHNEKPDPIPPHRQAEFLLREKLGVFLERIKSGEVGFADGFLSDKPTLETHLASKIPSTISSLVVIDAETQTLSSHTLSSATTVSSPAHTVLKVSRSGFYDPPKPESPPPISRHCSPLSTSPCPSPPSVPQDKHLHLERPRTPLSLSPSSSMNRSRTPSGAEFVRNHMSTPSKTQTPTSDRDSNDGGDGADILALQLPKLLDDKSMSISVSDSKKIGSGESQYISYKIATKVTLGKFRSRSFSVRRRLTDVCSLQKRLSMRHPEIILPSLPKVSEEAGAQEREVVESFLKWISEQTFAEEDEDVCAFLQANYEQWLRRAEAWQISTDESEGNAPADAAASNDFKDTVSTGEVGGGTNGEESGDEEEAQRISQELELMEKELIEARSFLCDKEAKGEMRREHCLLVDAIDDVKRLTVELERLRGQVAGIIIGAGAPVGYKSLTSLRGELALSERWSPLDGKAEVVDSCMERLMAQVERLDGLLTSAYWKCICEVDKERGAALQLVRSQAAICSKAIMKVAPQGHGQSSSDFVQAVSNITQRISSNLFGKIVSRSQARRAFVRIAEEEAMEVRLRETPDQSVIDACEMIAQAIRKQCKLR
mmetsp:Transcript_42469/g.70725  ORF Transcript_42469/g.70725 Transcript_42469/m.70725 type:complete len:733 (+) Transcript_42469:145-2343(+)|eukprot:CAMPEP_0184673192 /NCGR_PEP_ID=MMETSP0308-20130426/86543_1 /TAXON_ID=38269 /ORGANISM="Gloeochaete witrockiana, Strain SAG 46.84" /LENGTH=732 /DNA_ID=CAMNT_0027120649 /DNA_START=51 /DNA_END=2249 /DNA_ORIENTATION=-